MKAAVYDKYGPPEVVHISDVPKPIPKDDEILVKVRATTVTTGDWRVRSLEVPSPVFWLPVRLVFGWKAPTQRVLGTEFSGEVIEVGARVDHVKVGENLIVASGAKMGAHAEFVCVPPSMAFVKKPDNVGFEEAASFSFGGLTALHYLRDLGKTKQGDEVMIYGASGAIGTFAVQLAKHFGAKVTGVCGAKHVELVKSLGADNVIDYTKCDFTQVNQRFDIVFDTVGKTSFAHCRKILKPSGIFLASILTLTEIRQMLWTSLTSGQKVVGGVVTEKTEDLEFLINLLAKGEIKSVIGRRYTLDEIVEAYRHVETGHKTGNVVITM